MDLEIGLLMFFSFIIIRPNHCSNIREFPYVVFMTTRLQELHDPMWKKTLSSILISTWLVDPRNMNVS